jgi:hypothetical protein
MLAQRRDHSRLGRQLHRLQPIVAVAKALASLGDADEVVEIELLTHVRQHLEWKVQQGGHAGGIVPTQDRILKWPHLKIGHGDRHRFPSGLTWLDAVCAHVYLCGMLSDAVSRRRPRRAQLLRCDARANRMHRRQERAQNQSKPHALRQKLASSTSFRQTPRSS